MGEQTHDAIEVPARKSSNVYNVIQRLVPQRRRLHLSPWKAARATFLCLSFSTDTRSHVMVHPVRLQVTWESNGLRKHIYLCRLVALVILKRISKGCLFSFRW